MKILDRQLESASVFRRIKKANVLVFLRGHKQVVKTSEDKAL